MGGDDALCSVPLLFSDMTPQLLLVQYDKYVQNAVSATHDIFELGLIPRKIAMWRYP